MSTETPAPRHLCGKTDDHYYCGPIGSLKTPAAPAALPVVGDLDLEALAEAVHDAYLVTCKRLGWGVKPENQVPYSALTEDSKELDRASVRAVLRALRSSPPRDPLDIKFVREGLKTGVTVEDRWQAQAAFERILSARAQPVGGSPAPALEAEAEGPKAPCKRCGGLTVKAGIYGYICGSCWNAAHEGYGQELVPESPTQGAAPASRPTGAQEGEEEVPEAATPSNPIDSQEGFRIVSPGELPKELDRISAPKAETISPYPCKHCGATSPIDAKWCGICDSAFMTPEPNAEAGGAPDPLREALRGPSVGEVESATSVDVLATLKPFYEAWGHIKRNRAKEYFPALDDNELVKWRDLCKAAETYRILSTERRP